MFSAVLIRDRKCWNRPLLIQKNRTLHICVLSVTELIALKQDWRYPHCLLVVTEVFYWGNISGYGPLALAHQRKSRFVAHLLMRWSRVNTWSMRWITYCYAVPEQLCHNLHTFLSHNSSSLSFWRVFLLHPQWLKNLHVWCHSCVEKQREQKEKYQKFFFLLGVVCAGKGYCITVLISNFLSMIFLCVSYLIQSVLNAKAQ